MKKLIITTLLISLLFSWMCGQNLPQTVRGTIHDVDSKLPLAGNKTGRLLEYYDASQPNVVPYQTQFGFFPNLMYSVYF